MDQGASRLGGRVICYHITAMTRRFTAHEFRPAPPARPAGPARPSAVASKTTQPAKAAKPGTPDVPGKGKETGGPEGPEPTRYGDWERKGICVDF